MLFGRLFGMLSVKLGRLSVKLGMLSVKLDMLFGRLFGRLSVMAVDMADLALDMADLALDMAVDMTELAADAGLEAFGDSYVSIYTMRWLFFQGFKHFPISPIYGGNRDKCRFRDI